MRGQIPWYKVFVGGAQGDGDRDEPAWITLAPLVEGCELERDGPGTLGRGEEIIGLGVKLDDSIALAGELEEGVVGGGSEDKRRGEEGKEGKEGKEGLHGDW
jgi:hypothetical protein